MTAAATTLNRYKVEPFSAASYEKNFGKLESTEYGCAICGKSVVFPYLHEAVIVNGGTWATTSDEAENVDDSGYMGVWGIGPNCHKKYLVRAAA